MNEQHTRLGTGPQLPPLQASLAAQWSLRPPQAVDAGSEALMWGGMSLYQQQLSPRDTEAGRARNPCPKVLGTQQPN